ncbi:heavy metal-associated isoprenylated plant protein 39-like [Impatiens glandulifera]|uniref:heavy metal-associated isoprenylated plant protein 39-like n=1 Tax=Impatiens glandulifera TaxID=253017 RepID=UPI001FB12E9A|nr:heavy metal-associated isoprenylated plant protein 39-like [Impatiens glandulifera]
MRSLRNSPPVPLSSIYDSVSQKIVMKVMAMTDDKTKKKTIEAAADILGVDSMAVDMNEQTLTVIGEMDTVAVVKKVKKSVGHVEILFLGSV